MRHLFFLTLTCCLALSVSAQDDTALAERVRSILNALTGYEQVEVQVSHGVVRLEGTVLEADRITRIEEAIAQLDGVVMVDNQLALDLEVGSRVDPMRQRLQEMGRTALSLTPLLAVAVVVMLLFWLLSRLVQRADFLLQHVARSRPMRELLLRTAGAVIFVVGLVVALDIVGATAVVGGVLGAAGLAGIAIGFAFKDLIENYIASIMLSVRQPFRPDDHVVIDDREGIVTGLSTRSTMLLTLDGNSLRIPNAQVFKAVILNYSNTPERRFQISVGLGYGVDLDAAMALGVETLLQTEGVLANPGPIARAEALGDSSIKVIFFGWVNQQTSNFGKVRSDALVRVRNAFVAHQVDMPEPIFNLRITDRGTEQPAPEPPAPATDPVLVERSENQQVEFVRRKSKEAREEVDNLIQDDKPLAG